MRKISLGLFCILVFLLNTPDCRAQTLIDMVTPDDLRWQRELPADQSDSTDIYGDALPHGATKRLGTLRFRINLHNAAPPLFVKDDSLVAVPGTAQAIYLLNAKSGQIESRIKFSSPHLFLRSLSASANGRYLAVLAMAHDRVNRRNKPMIKVWDTTDWTEKSSTAWESTSFSVGNASAVSSDGSAVAYTENRGVIKMWTSKETYTVELGLARQDCQELRFSADDQLLLIRNRDSLFAWNVQERKVQYSHVNSDRPVSMAVASESPLIAIGKRQLGGATLLDLLTGERIGRIKANVADSRVGEIGVALSPDGELLTISAPYAGVIQTFDVATGKMLRETLVRGGAPRALSVSVDGKRIAAVCGGSSVGIWELENLNDVAAEYVGHIKYPETMYFTGEGNLISSAGNQTIVWDLATCKPLHSLEATSTWAGQGSITCIDSSPDGSQLLTLGFGVGLDAWNLASGANTYRLPRHGRVGRHGAHACGFSADGSRFFSFGPEFYLRSWDTVNGMAIDEKRPFPPDAEIELDELGNIQRPQGGFFGGAGMPGAAGPPAVLASFLSTDGKTLAYWACKFYFVATETGEIERSVEVPPSQTVACTRDLSLAAFGSMQGGTISIIKLTTGDTIHEIESDSTSVYPVSFSEDGSMLGVRLYRQSESGNRLGDSSFRIYDSESGQETHRIPGEYFQIGKATFSPDARTIAVGQADGTILLLELAQFEVD